MEEGQPNRIYAHILMILEMAKGINKFPSNKSKFVTFV